MTKYPTINKVRDFSPSKLGKNIYTKYRKELLSLLNEELLQMEGQRTKTTWKEKTWAGNSSLTLLRDAVEKHWGTYSFSPIRLAKVGWDHPACFLAGLQGIRKSLALLVGIQVSKNKTKTKKSLEGRLVTPNQTTCVLTFQGSHLAFRNLYWRWTATKQICPGCSSQYRLQLQDTGNHSNVCKQE